MGLKKLVILPFVSCAAGLKKLVILPFVSCAAG